jgi:hypothetical protein
MDIQTPQFKRGDILTAQICKEEGNSAFVLDSLDNARGFVVGEKVGLFGVRISDDIACFEYCHEAITGKDSTLIAVGDYIKKNPKISMVLLRRLYEVCGEKSPPLCIDTDEMPQITVEMLLAAYEIHRRIDVLLNDFEEYINSHCSGVIKLNDFESPALSSISDTGLYSGIPSRDIALHCQSIERIFTPLEQAIIICSRDTLSQRCKAWQEIIDTHPDEELPETDDRWWKTHYTSLHTLLRDYIAFKNSLVEKMKSDEPGAVYVYWKGEKDSKRYFSYDEVVAALSADCESNPDGQGSYFVVKHYHYNDNEYFDDEPFSMKITTEGEVIDVFDNCYELCSDAACCRCLSGLSMNFPHSFKKGDILYPCDKRPFVMETDDDSPDFGMIHPGASMGDLYQYSIEFNKVARDYCLISLGTEYFRGELTGRERILPAISSHLKGELSSAELLNTYAAILSEEDNNQ